MNKTLIALLLCGLSAVAFAKLPAPSEEAKAQAAQAAAKTAHTGMVEGYLLCKSQDKVAAYVQKTNKVKAGKPTATAPCADPGKFVYTSSDAAPVAAPAAAPATASAKKS